MKHAVIGPPFSADRSAMIAWSSATLSAPPKLTFIGRAILAADVLQHRSAAE